MTITLVKKSFPLKLFDEISIKMLLGLSLFKTESHGNIE